MKKTIIAAALAAFAAAPAFAQQPEPPVTQTQPRPVEPYLAAPVQPNADAGTLPQPGTFAYEGYAGPNVVVSMDGRIVGQDPDPNVRFDLQRNADHILGYGS